VDDEEALYGWIEHGQDGEREPVVVYDIERDRVAKLWTIAIILTDKAFKLL
jgi:hypothetical protein